MLSNHKRIYKKDQKKEISDSQKALDDFNNSPELAQFTTSTRLLAKRKELLDVQSALNTKRKEFDERLTMIKDKELNLAKERDRLTGHIMELDKFIRENEMKKERAEEKERTEVKSGVQLSAQINELVTLIGKKDEELMERRQLLEKKYNRYHKYLQDVVTQSRGQENLDEVEVLMKRYTSLRDHNIELRQNAQNLNDRRIQQEQELKKYNDTKKAEIINFNMNIAKLNRILEEQNVQTSQSQKQMEEGQIKSSYSKVVTGQVEMACKNLYRRVSNFSRLQSKTREAEEDGDLDKMLERIRIKVEDFGIIKEKVDELIAEQSK